MAGFITTSDRSRKAQTAREFAPPDQGANSPRRPGVPYSGAAIANPIRERPSFRFQKFPPMHVARSPSAINTMGSFSSLASCARSQAVQSLSAMNFSRSGVDGHC
jgi:hypothetical protein